MQCITALQEPQTAKAAAFYKGALLRLSDALSDILQNIRHIRDKLLQCAQSRKHVTLSSDVQQRLTVLENCVLTLQHSLQSCLLSSSRQCLRKSQPFAGLCNSEWK